MNNLGKVFEHTAIDFLVWPGEVITGSNGRILWVFHQEFALHIVDDSSREEDAHRRLAAGQQMQMLLLWHRGATFTTCEDNGLRALRDGKLAPQFSRCSEERRDAGRDMIVHLMLIEEGHLLLDSAKDTRVACMQTDDEMASLVMLLHQCTLFLEVHIR